MNLSLHRTIPLAGALLLAVDLPESSTVENKLVGDWSTRRLRGPSSQTSTMAAGASFWLPRTIVCLTRHARSDAPLRGHATSTIA